GVRSRPASRGRWTSSIRTPCSVCRAIRRRIEFAPRTKRRNRSTITKTSRTSASTSRIFTRPKRKQLIAPTRCLQDKRVERSGHMKRAAIVGVAAVCLALGTAIGYAAKETGAGVAAFKGKPAKEGAYAALAE